VTAAGEPEPTSSPSKIILGEIRPGDPSTWQPRSFDEWQSRERLQTFLSAWSEQIRDERMLRRRFSGWIFTLISLQTLGVFALVVADGAGWMTLRLEVLQVLIPSVLAEVFGLGFLVAKYLFSQPLRHSLDSLVAKGRADHEGSKST
jgi:hypothetical protein